MNVLQLPIGALGSLLTASRPPCPFTEGLLGAQALVQLHVAHGGVLEKHVTASQFSTLGNKENTQYEGHSPALASVYRSPTSATSPW